MPKPSGYSSLRWRATERRVRKQCQGARDPDACFHATMRRISNYINARERRDRNVSKQEKIKT